MNHFEVGQDVVCINDDWSKKHPGWVKEVKYKPVKGQIYKIREIFVINNAVGIRLIEIVNPPIKTRDGVMEPAFEADRFRPVKRTNIDNLLKIANKPPNSKRTKLKTRRAKQFDYVFDNENDVFWFNKQ